MDPFNIVVKRAAKQLALNIHPKDPSGYMVLFEGSLVGEVFLDVNGNVWNAVSASDLVTGGDLAYPCDSSVDCEGLLSDSAMIDQIGKEISRVLGIAG